MIESDSWHVRLEPPGGGLSRLVHSIDAAPTRRHGTRRSLAIACAFAVAVMAILITDRAKTAPQRAFRQRLDAALQPLMTHQAAVERGIARELPSGRSDVRILVLAPSGAAAPKAR